jgi:hypothetical protein
VAAPRPLTGAARLRATTGCGKIRAVNRIARLLAVVLCLCLAAQPSLARVGGDCAHDAAAATEAPESSGHEGHAGHDRHAAHDMSGERHAGGDRAGDCGTDCTCAMSACHYTGSAAGLLAASARVPSLLAAPAPSGRLSMHAASPFDQSPLRPPIVA